MLGIKNESGEKLVAKYDGQEYVFANGQTTVVPDEAAKHIFGYGNPDKTTALLRLGWVGPGQPVANGLERLDSFKFHAVDQVVREEREDKTIHLPRKVVGEDDKQAQSLAHQEGNKKQFAK